MNRYTSDDPSAIGVYEDMDKAEHTIEELRRAGFGSDEIGVIGHVGPEESVSPPPEANAPEYNAINSFLRGALVGAIVGGFVTFVIPGLAAIAQLGRWFDVLGGAALGALACGLILAFGSFVFMRPTTRLVAAELEKGHIIVTVKNPSRRQEAISVLRRQGLLVE